MPGLSRGDFGPDPVRCPGGRDAPAPAPAPAPTTRKRNSESMNRDDVNGLRMARARRGGWVARGVDIATRAGGAGDPIRQQTKSAVRFMP